MTETPSYTILLIDDEEMVRTLLKRALEKDGYEVFLANSKSDAIDVLGNSTPHLLLVDKNLPDGSGLDFIETARNAGYTGEVIVITGYSDTESAIKSVELSVFRYIRKPFDLDTLKTDIQNALKTGEMRKNLAARTKELEETNNTLRNALSKFQESEYRRIQAERLASIGYLASSVAHEINTPLSLLSMSIPYFLSELENLIKNGILESDPASAKATLIRILNSLAPTQESVEFLMTLAQDLHSMGKTDETVNRPVKLSDTVNSALRIVRHKLKTKTRIRIDVPDTLFIQGKNRRLIQVFINLLTNAGRAIRNGDVEDNLVSVTGYRTDAGIVIDVADTGIGISEEYIEKIFDKYASFSGLEDNQGSGIGLSIVKELVNEHKGTISVISQEGIGTTFRIVFPLSEARTSTPPPMEQHASRTTPHDMIRAKRTILFIDSNPDHLDAYANSFGQMHTVLTSAHIEDALEQIDKHQHSLDMIVMELTQAEDINLFFNHLDKRFPALLNHVIGTGTDTEEIATFAANRRIKYLVRPFRPGELLAAIYRVPPRHP